MVSESFKFLQRMRSYYAKHIRQAWYDYDEARSMYGSNHATTEYFKMKALRSGLSQKEVKDELAKIVKEKRTPDIRAQFSRRKAEKGFNVKTC